MNNYVFGNYICELREKKGLTQSQLGQKRGVSNKAVSKWENGAAYPSSELMLPLAKELGVSLEELYMHLSDCKSEKTKIRRVLEWLVVHSKPIIFGFLAWAIVSLILFCIFGTAPDKMMVVVLSIVLPLLYYWGIRFAFVISKINPLISPRLWDIVSLLFLFLWAFFAGMQTVNFITAFPNGFSPGVGISVGILSGLLHANRKRLSLGKNRSV